MRTILLKNQKVLTSLLLALSPFASSTAFAAGTAQAARPAARASVGTIQANATYLNSTRLPARSTLNDDIFTNPALNRQIRTDFENRQAQYETRQNQGLTNLGDEESYANSMRQFATSAMKQIQKLHVRKNLRRLKGFAENNFDGARDPIAVAAFMGALYQGTAFRFRLSDELRMESRASVRKKEASMNMGIPGLSGAVSYGANNPEDRLTASLSKSLVDNLSAEVNTTSKGTLQLNYGLSF